MKLNYKQRLGACLLAIGAMTLAGPASAALIDDGGLTLDTDPTVFYQQTEVSPCVIGGENCLNPVFDYTVVGPGGDGRLDEAESPTYAVDDILTLVGANSFIIGLDYNQTVNPQTLYYFEACYGDGFGCQRFEIDGGTELQVNNNGVGFSDFLLSGFVIPDGATTVTFGAEWFNNDGADRYFLIGVDSEIHVPEPGTLGLLGLGLLGAGLARLRSARRAS